MTEGLSPLKTRESCPIPKSPVWIFFFSPQGANYFLLHFFSAFMVIFNVVKEILLIFVQLRFYYLQVFYRDTEIVKQQTKKFIYFNYEFTFNKH